MTGEVDTPPPSETTTEEKPAEKQPQVKEEKAEKEDNPKPQPPDQSPSKPDAAGVFGGWGFDVNAVAGNLGGLFSAPDPTATDDVTTREADPTDPAEDISATAANIAKSATAELEHASKAAQQTIGKAAQEIGKGWGTLNSFLDDMLAAKPDAAGTDPESDADALNQFHALFPELASDDVVDHFKCGLLQKYRCYLNNATPEKSYLLRGRLYVSTLHIAMYITDDGGEFGGQPLGISLPFTDINKIQKGAKAMLRVVTKEQTSLIFADFESESHFSGALSLLEHMYASAAQSAAKPEQPEGGKDVPAT